MLPEFQSYRDGFRSDPPNIWGFKDQLPEICRGLYETRSHGLDVSFEQYLFAWAQNKISTPDDNIAAKLVDAAKQSDLELARLKNGVFGQPSEDEKMLFGVLLHDVGIECLNNVRAIDLISVEYGLRGIFNELVRRAIVQGIKLSPIYPRIVAEQQASANAPTVYIPTIDTTQNAAEAVGEAVQFPMAVAVFSSRSVNMRKYGLALRITDEAIRYSTMNILQLVLTTQGQKLGMIFDAAAMYVSLNGDQVDNSMTPAIIGVADTGDGFTYADWVHICLHMAAVGMIPNVIIAGFTESENLLNIEEFKEPIYRIGDRTFIQVTLQNLMVQKSVEILTKSNFPANTIQILDSSNSLIQCNGRPLLTEQDRNILNETNLAKFSQEICFANALREARVTVLTNQTRTTPYTFDDYTFFAPHDNVPIQL